MSAKRFLDTNILVYALGPHDVGRSEVARSLLLDVIASRTGVISYQVIQEFLNLAFRKFEDTLKVETASGYVRDVVRGLEVLPWSLGLMEQGISIKHRYGFSWYDSLVVAAAIHSGCSTLYTEDLQSGQTIDGLTVVNPFIPALQ